MVLKEVGNSDIYLKALPNKVGIYTAYMIVVFVACARLSEYLRRRENKTCMQPLPTRIFCIRRAVTIFTHYHKLLEQAKVVLVAPEETYVSSILRPEAPACL